MIKSIRPQTVNIDTVKYSAIQTVDISLLRLDKIHPVISGNKWFKLKEYLKLAIEGNKKGIITFGGAWSNHIVATAGATHLAGLSSIGIIRGEEPARYSQTLQDALAFGMDLRFLSRAAFREAGKAPGTFLPETNDWIIVPEGGKGESGVAGASAILDLVPDLDIYTHICCAVGTGTMLAGLTNAARPWQKLVGISTLKGEDELTAEVSAMLKPGAARFSIFFEYHFGGYAKHPPALVDYMNQFFRQTRIPTDIVYTSKLLFGIEQLLNSGYFPENSKVLVIHSGGLQGNRSLKAGELLF